MPVKGTVNCSHTSIVENDIFKKHSSKCIFGHKFCKNCKKIGKIMPKLQPRALFLFGEINIEKNSKTKLFVFPTFLVLSAQFLANIFSSYFDEDTPMFAITSNIYFIAPICAFLNVSNKIPIAAMAAVLFCKLLTASFHYHAQLYKRDAQIHAEDTCMMVISSFAVFFFMCSMFFSHEKLIFALLFAVVLVGFFSQPHLNAHYKTFTFVCFSVIIAAISALTILVECSKVYVTCKQRLSSVSIYCAIFVTCFLVFVPRTVVPSSLHASTACRASHITSCVWQTSMHSHSKPKVVRKKAPGLVALLVVALQRFRTTFGRVLSTAATQHVHTLILTPPRLLRERTRTRSGLHVGPLPSVAFAVTACHMSVSRSIEQTEMCVGTVAYGLSSSLFPLRSLLRLARMSLYFLISASDGLGTGFGLNGGLSLAPCSSRSAVRIEVDGRRRPLRVVWVTDA
jgi:hypothetical protein